MTRSFVVFILAFSLVAALRVSAVGYVLPAPFVIEQMLGNLNLPERMKVDQKLLVYPAKEDDRQENQGILKPEDTDLKETEPKSFAQKVYFRRPGAYRSDIDTPEFQQIHISSGSSSITVIDGAVLSETAQWHACYKDLFLFSSRPQLVRHLERLGIDMKVSSLGRFDRELVYVAGARYPDESVPQLWIEKTFFRPIRWIVAPGALPEDPPALEIRYLDWQGIDRTWYPGRIEFYENGRQVRSIAVENMDVNPSVPESFFDISDVSGKYAPSGNEPAGTSGASEEVRRQIEEFKRIYESPTQ